MARKVSEVSTHGPEPRGAVWSVMHLMAPLEQDACHVWWAHLSELRAEHDRLLEPSDLTRRQLLVDPADRQRLTLGVAVARLVLGVYLEAAPSALVIDRTCVHCGEQHGKPQLPIAPDLHFSISHSSCWVMVAVLLHRPVGVDVEEISRFGHAELEDLADEILSPDERAVFVRCPVRERSTVLAMYWTRKEAAVKATGQGLQTPLHDVHVPPPELPAAVAAAGDDELSLIHIRSVTAPDGFAAAVAALGRSPVRVVEHRATELLGWHRR